MRGIIAFATAILLPIAGHVRAQVPERRLPARPAWAVEEPFSDIVSVRELSDGRVVVIDGREQRVAVVDLQRGTVRNVGRKGHGPGEFERPVRLLAMPGDTTWVIDVEAGRALVLGPDANPAGSFSTFGGDSSVSPTRVQGVLGGRWMYYPGRAPRREGGPLEAPDSMPLERFDRSTRKVDRLTMIGYPRRKITTKSQGGKITSVNVMSQPLGGGDLWEVRADGRVVIARHDPYRLEIASVGQPPLQGPAVPAEPVRVTDADRKEFVANVPNGAGIDPATLEFPEFKPPFLARGLVLGPGSETWVRRTTRAGAPATPYDVFDGGARRIAVLMVPSGIRIALVTPRGVLAIRTDDDGLQYVERYALAR